MSNIIDTINLMDSGSFIIFNNVDKYCWLLNSDIQYNI